MPSRPVISIVGSVNPGRRYEPPLRNPDTAHQACEELGKELALKSCDLLVYSGSGEFIEADVVRGFIASNAATPASIHVRSPSDATAVFAEYDRHKELFDPRIDSSPDWEVSFYRSLVEGHGLIIIGGGRSTLITGLIALTFIIPLV